MSTTEKDLIVAFLSLCLANGCYSFKINGSFYPLDSESHIQSILTAIERADPDVQRYRIKQAEWGISQLKTAHAVA